MKRAIFRAIVLGFFEAVCIFVLLIIIAWSLHVLFNLNRPIAMKPSAPVIPIEHVLGEIP